MLVHLSRAVADVNIYAPDIPQMHVLNHAKGEVAEGETRWDVTSVSYEWMVDYTVSVIGLDNG